MNSILLTLKVAFVTTIFLVLISMPLAYLVVRVKKRYRIFIEAILSLPLVLPPTVLGFYLLIILNPNGWLSTSLRTLGFSGNLTFNFTGLVIGSVIYSLPFCVQPLINSFDSVPKIYLESARLMGAKRWDRFINIILPLSKKGLLLGSILSFAHTIGEFGVVMMIGGNIPGVTRVVSIDIFNHVEALEFSKAHQLSLVMLLFSFFTLIVIYFLNTLSERDLND